MSDLVDPVALLSELVRAPSVTPAAGPPLDVLDRVLTAAGFDVHRPVFSAPDTPDVENLFAAFGEGAPHVTLAGHVDVVPVGDETDWTHPPFSAAVDGDRLFGRGSTDMKGGVAAMAAAAVRVAGEGLRGRVSLLVTGDEEGPAVNGTAKLLAWAAERGERFDAAIVGEPSSLERLGDQIKVGRRGSYSATLTVLGVQGHAAYPERADNPVHGLVALLGALLAAPLDDGSERFQPSTLQVVSVDVGNPAWNVIPARAVARFNSRYNDRWTRETLRAEIERRLASACNTLEGEFRYRLEDEPSPSEVFLTEDAKLIETVSDAVEAETAGRPALSTGGGTSDARFIKDYCPVVEFGTVGKTMHQVDESVSIAEVEAATRVFERVLRAYLSP